MPYCNNVGRAVVTECKVNGEWVKYDMCSDSQDAYSDINKELIGYTTLCRFDGKECKFADHSYYWKRIK
jgi:hypothetical protein